MNITVLMVDDAYEKVKIVASVLNEIEGFDFKHIASARDALKHLKDNPVDIMIVDLQIPVELGAEPNPSGGVELIDHCELDSQVHTPTHIIGVTALKDCFKSYKKYFEDNGWPLLHDIQDREYIRQLLNTKAKHVQPHPIKADIAIITALEKIELESVLALPCNWKKLNDDRDNNLYYLGEISLASGETRTVVTTSCSRMGMTAASAATMKICKKFAPDLLIMTGIAAGVEGKTNFGDIIVADPCWDWCSGKLVASEGKPKLMSDPHQIGLDPVYRSLFQSISANRTYLDDISSSYVEGEPPSHEINLHVGPLASGPFVLEDPDTVSEIQGQHRKAIGIEMEAYGFLYSVSVSDSPAPKSIVLKSVCDFANAEKNDDWQSFAAHTSAQMAYRIIVDHLG